MGGLPVIILPSVEKRFSLTSAEIGVLAAANDIAAAFFVIFIGFYGDYGNKIKYVAGGAAVAGLYPSICCTLFLASPDGWVTQKCERFLGPREIS